MASISGVSALSAPSTTSASETAGVTQTKHKHGPKALDDTFATLASNAVGTIGSSAVSLSGNLATALGNLKSAI